MNIRKSTLVAAMAIFAAVGLGACSTPGNVQMDGARSELYDSIEGLAADSSLIAVVEVESHEVLSPASDRGIPYTLSKVSVISTFAPEALAGELPKSASANTHTAGSELVVRQMGTTEVKTPAPLLSVGRHYLLFLTPSMLEGDSASQFYVTGGSAGVFDAPDDVATRRGDSEFTHGPFEEGDTLPDTLSTKDLVK